MASLLGSEYCVGSLRDDVSDLQTAVTDVVSRAGPVKFPSWKYPDKDSNEVDVKELLELYSFSSDVESNQVAHIVLLELVVDRLVYLLQLMSKYIDQTLTIGLRKATAVQSSSSSIGLVVKKYWSRMVHTHTVVQQLQSEVRLSSKTLTRKIDEQAEKIRALEEELQQYKTGVGSLSFGAVLCSSRNIVSQTEIARDESSRPCQTVETAFVPCEACHRVQHCLKEIGTRMNHICESQQLPCSLAKFQSEVEDMEWLSANDVGHWCAEQSKDLGRIDKHFEFLVSTIEPLKRDLENEKRKTADLESKLSQSVKEVKSEKNTQAIMQKQFQNKLKEVEKQRNETVNKVEKQKDELGMKLKEAEKEVTFLRTEQGKQVASVQRLETVRKHLEQELHQRQEKNGKVMALEDEKRQMEEALSGLKKKLKANERELSKEQVRVRSLNIQTEAVQGKQGSMLQRIDDLDRENEKLRDDVAELEDLKEQLEGRLDRTEDLMREANKESKEQKEINSSLMEERDALEQQIQDLSDTVKNFEQQVIQAKENERLLIMYPDLHGPVNPDMNGTGDIALDMENQVKANTMRILILEEQNASMRNSITKMHETQKRGPIQMLSNPVPLWRPRSPDDMMTESSPSEMPSPEVQEEMASSGLMAHEERARLVSEERRVRPEPEEARRTTQSASTRPVSSKPRREDVRQSFTVGRGRTTTSASKKSRPAGGTQSSSFQTYMKLKNSGMMKSATRDPPASKFKEKDYLQEDTFACKGQARNDEKAAKPPRQGKENSDFEHSRTFTCVKCDKMYNSRRDFDVHNMYCCGGL